MNCEYIFHFSVKIVNKERYRGFIEEAHTIHLQEILRHFFLFANSQELTKESGSS